MALPTSALGSVGTLLIIFSVLAAFFRRILVSVLITIVAEVILFILFPNLLLDLVAVVAAVRNSVG